MPKEYLDCVKNKMAEGAAKADAQKSCAIAYYKKHGKTPQQAEKEMSEMNHKLFQEHKTIKNDDGTYNILEVPIFELGEHKGFDYNEQWANETVQNHIALKEKKRLPRLIIGHTTEGTEKKAFGFLDNIKKTGQQIMADLVKIKENVFNSIKDMEFPGRSVEVNPEKKKFTALALLGGSEPYFENLEPIEIAGFEEDKDAIWIPFAEKTIQQTLEDRIKKQEKERELSDVWWIGKELIDEISWDAELDSDEKKEKANKILIEMLDLIKKEGEAYINSFEQGVNEMRTFTEAEHQALLENAKRGFSAEFVAQFKEKHGVTPEEALQKMTDNGKKVKEIMDNIRQERITNFCASLKEKGLAPAIVDAFAKVRSLISDEKENLVSFSEEKKDLPVGAYVDELITALVSYAEKGQLLIPKGESGQANFKAEGGKVGNYSATMSEDEMQKFHQEVLKFQQAKNIASYEAAVFQFLETKKN